MVACAEGVPCWVDAMLPDVAAGRRFYGELFGWTFDEGAAGYRPYTWARLGGKDVAALVPKSDGRMPTVWNVYLATGDAAAATARIREAGGRVIVAPRWIGDLGVMATAADPGGAVFGLWQTGSHPGFARRGIPGTYGWTEVHTREPRVVDAFYRTVFGYEARPGPHRAPEPGVKPPRLRPARHPRYVRLDRGPHPGARVRTVFGYEARPGPHRAPERRQGARYGGARYGGARRRKVPGLGRSTPPGSCCGHRAASPPFPATPSRGGS
jgi:predicted enzyme related to lactoylglutathione lyase